MGYQIIGDTAMALHFGFLAYLVFGGFLVWRWPKAFWPHLLIALYALDLVFADWPCVLTEIEEWARVRNGGEPMPSGFIEHYLAGVLYPPGHLFEAEIAAGVVVALSWIGAAVTLHLRRRQRRAPSEPDAHGVKET